MAQDGPTPPVQAKLTPVPELSANAAPKGPADPDVPQRPLTASEAAKIALRRQPDIAAAEAAKRVAEARKQQSQSALSPFLALTAGYNKVEALQGGGTGGGVVPTSGGGAGFSGWQGTANVRQLLFDFNRTREMVRQQSALVAAAGAGLTRAQADVVLLTKQAYYALQQAQRNVEVQNLNLAARRSQFDLAQARLTSGLGGPSDVVRAQTSIAEVVGLVEQARNAADLARTNLALRMGIDPRTPLLIAETEEAEPADPDMNALMQRALKSRPEIRQAFLASQAAKHSVSAAQLGDMPSFNTSLGLASRGINFPPGNDFLSLGITVNWNPFDSGLTAGRVKEAKANLSLAEAGFQNAVQAVQADVTQSLFNLRTAKSVVAAARSQLANAEEGVRLAEGRYRGGVGTFLEVLDAQSAVVIARTQLVSGRQQLESAKVSVERAVGTAPTP